jgi:hypothetical protein
LPIAWRAYRLCLNPYGGYWVRLCPFILARDIKAKALKYAPKTSKKGRNHRQRIQTNAVKPIGPIHENAAVTEWRDGT